MIPASYLFKDIYQQTWEEPDAPAVTHHRRRFLDGLATPFAGAIAAVLHRRDRFASTFIPGESKTSW